MTPGAPDPASIVDGPGPEEQRIHPPPPPVPADQQRDPHLPSVAPDPVYPAPNTQTQPPAFDPPPAGETGRELTGSEAGAALAAHVVDAQQQLNDLTNAAALRVEVPLERDALSTSDAAAAEAADRAETGAPILDSEINQPSTQPVTGADPGDETGDTSAAAAQPTTPTDLSAADEGQADSSTSLPESAAADLAPPVEKIFPPAQSDGPRAGPASQSHGRPNHKFHT